MASKKEAEANLHWTLEKVLPSLNQNQLVKLQAHVSLLVGKTRSERALNEEQTAFYDILTSRMRRFRISGVPLSEGKTRYPRTRAFNKKQFVAGYEKLCKFWEPMKLTRTETTRMQTLYSDSLVLYVSQLYPREVGMKKVVECLGRVGEIMDMNFPGYFDDTELRSKRGKSIARLWLGRSSEEVVL